MELYLIRHSITPGNLKRQYVGRWDQPLAPQGIQLAKERRERMPQGIERVWVSPMQRCRQTAALLFPEHHQQVVEELRECDFGEFEGKTWEELQEEPVYRRLLEGDCSVTFPQGESMKGFMARCVGGMKKIAEEARQEGVQQGAVVAHGGTWMGTMAQLGRPVRPLHQWQVQQCRGYRVQVCWNPLLLQVLEEL